MAFCSKEGILKLFQWALSVAIVVLYSKSPFEEVDGAEAMEAVFAIALSCCITLTIIGIIYCCKSYNVGSSCKRIECVHAVVCTMVYIASMVISAIMARKFANVSPLSRYLISCAVLSGLAMALYIIHAVLLWKNYRSTIERSTHDNMEMDGTMQDNSSLPRGNYGSSNAGTSNSHDNPQTSPTPLNVRVEHGSILSARCDAIVGSPFSSNTLVLPSHWESMRGQVCKRVALSPNSQEYQRVLALFHETLRIDVNKIERIQHPTHYEPFQAQKKMVTGDLTGRRSIITRELFHGTDADKCDSICKNNFNRSHAGINGTLYGNGVYFATTAEYSHSYASGNPKHMFLAEVITGEYCQGNSSMKVAPLQTNNSPFDSVVDNTINPTMFVVFKDASVYPSFLVTYSGILPPPSEASGNSWCTII